MVRTFALSLAVAVMCVAVTGASASDIGDDAPNFTAMGVDGNEYSLESISKDSDIVVVCFTCNQCPVAVAYEDRFIQFTKEFEGKKVTFVALNCNSRSEGMEVMRQRAEEKGFNFVYAFDESGASAKAYGAKVTPELFVVNQGKIAYHGTFDDSMTDPKTPHLVNAVNALLEGKTPEITETRPFGCGIKLK